MIICHFFSQMFGLWNSSAGFVMPVVALTLKCCLRKERGKKCTPIGGLSALSSQGSQKAYRSPGLVQQQSFFLLQKPSITNNPKSFPESAERSFVLSLIH